MSEVRGGRSDGLWRLAGRRLLSVARRAGWTGSEAFAEPWEALLACLDEMETAGSLCVPFAKIRARAPGSDLEAFFGELEASGLAQKEEDFGTGVEARSAAFVIDERGGRLYLQRHCALERGIAADLARLTRRGLPVDRRSASFLRQIARTGFVSDEQRAAIETGLSASLSLLCGGPGTGKTRTVAFLIEALLRERGDLTVYLAAPTGKAASRLMESVQKLMLSQAALFLPHPCRIDQHTLHKWLVLPNAQGVRPGRRGACLSCDVLLVDEASMMDAALAARLLSVIDEHRTRVVFLGDTHQLAAVGPGSVLADMTARREDGTTVLPVAWLTQSRRYDAGSPFGALAKFVLEAPDEERTAERLAEFFRGDRCRVHWMDFGSPARSTEPVRRWLLREVEDYAGEVRRAVPGRAMPPRERLRDLWRRAGSFRMLCAERGGPVGVDRCNEAAQACMRRVLEVPSTDPWYPGQLLMVRVNDDALGIANGEIAMAVPDGEGGWLAYFGDKDGGDEGSEPFLPAQLLGDADPAFAITIHQSQGSEFARVAVVMPRDSGSPLAARELLYTAVTRVIDAPKAGVTGSLALFASKDVARTSLQRETVREGGLADRLQAMTLR